MIYFLSTFGNPHKFPLDIFETITQSVLEIVKNQLDHEFDGDIIFGGNKKKVIPRYQVGGYCSDEQTITIYVDTQKFDIHDQNHVDLLRYVLAHELTDSLYYKEHESPLTLKDEIIFEGLADYCATQMIGDGEYLWTKPPIRDRSSSFPKSVEK